MDGTKAISDAVGDIFQMLVATAEAPNSPEFKYNLEIAEKVWNNAKRLIENPSLASYCDQGSEILMVNCIDAIDKNYEKLIDGIVYLFYDHQAIIYSCRNSRRCQKCSKHTK
jgi:hypothetical protein